MPFVHIRIAGERLPESNLNLLQEETTRLMESVLAKKAELTAVLVEQLPAGGWAVGGRTVPAAAHLEATITAGTNTAEEKARFIDKATALLKTICGTPLPLATYVVVREVPAESWGYDGRTQASRRPGMAPAAYSISSKSAERGFASGNASKQIVREFSRFGEKRKCSS